MRKRNLILILVIAILASGLTGFQMGRWSVGSVYGAEKDGWKLKAEKEAEKEEDNGTDAAEEDEWPQEVTIVEAIPAEEEQPVQEPEEEPAAETETAKPQEQATDEEINALIEEARHAAAEETVQ